MICKKIVEILRPYNRPITGEIEISKKIRVSKEEYVHFSNMVLQTFTNTIEDRDDSIQKIIKSRMIYIEDIFQNYGIHRSACTGRVDLLMYIDHSSVTDSVEVTSDMYIVQSSVKLRSGDIETFTGQLYSRLEGSTCAYGSLIFNSLAIENFATVKYSEDKYERSGHSNLLLILKNIDTKYINLILYEPHGYSEEDDTIYMTYVRKYNLEFVKTVRKYLQKMYKGKYRVKILKPVEISCRRGVQSYIGDRFGYCKLISTMWLFLILGLFTSDLKPEYKIYLADNLNLVEACLTTVKNLYSIVINFSADMINKYLVYLRSEETVNLFNSQFQVVYNKYYNKTGEETDDVDLKIRKCRAPKTYHSAEIPSKKGFGRSNCKECVNRSDCMSGNCVNNICSPSHFYTSGQDRSSITLLPGEEYNKRGNLPRLIGDICKYDSQCCSENCYAKRDKDTGILDVRRCHY